MTGLWQTEMPFRNSLERRTFVDWCWNYINNIDPGRLPAQDLAELLDLLNSKEGLRCLLSFEETDSQTFKDFKDPYSFTLEQTTPTGREYFSVRRRTFLSSNKSIVVVVASRNVAKRFIKRVGDSTRWRQQVGGF